MIQMTQPTMLLIFLIPADTVVDLTLTVTNPEDTTVAGGCDRINSDTLTLTVTPSPTADAGPSQTLCVGDDIVVAGRSQMKIVFNGQLTLLKIVQVIILNPESFRYFCSVIDYATAFTLLLKWFTKTPLIVVEL